jgi:hypothetical protein
MNEFVQRHAGSVIGVLSGFDRVLFRGTLMRLCNGGGLFDLMRKTGHALKEFGAFCESVTQEVKAASERVAKEAGMALQRWQAPTCCGSWATRFPPMARRAGPSRGRC